jgi:polysaccharide export outer membrane protein
MLEDHVNSMPCYTGVRTMDYNPNSPMQLLFDFPPDKSGPLVKARTFPFLAMLGLLSLIAYCAGCRAPAPGSSAAFSHFDAGAAHYATNLLQEGDLVTITFQYSTNFNALQKITLDGVLNLEAVGSVKAAGKTVPELQAELVKLYQPQVKNDVITIKLVTAATSVYVAGAVNRPGKIPLEHPMTVLEAVMEAGGFDPNRAKLSAVTVLRIQDGKQRSYKINLKQTLRGEIETPFYLKPFDIVHVPTKTFNF